VIKFPTPYPPLFTLGESFSDSEITEAIADNLETQFQPVTDPSVLAVTEMVDLALRSYLITPANERNSTNPEAVQEAIVVSWSVRLRARKVSRTGP